MVSTIAASRQDGVSSDFGLEAAEPSRRDKHPKPSYAISGGGPQVTIAMRDAAYFKSDGGQFLGLGVTNVIGWATAFTTPAPADAGSKGEGGGSGGDEEGSQGGRGIVGRSGRVELQGV